MGPSGQVSMTSTPALAHVRRRPGRPRQTPTAPLGGTTVGDRDGQSPIGLDSPGLTPRLLDLALTAQYLGVSPWTVRDLQANGTLRRVSIPLGGGRDLRKLLFDRADLDRLVEAWKDSALTPTRAGRYPKAPVRAGQR